MLAELFVPIGWLLDRDLHKRLRELRRTMMAKAAVGKWEVTAVAEQKNGAQIAIDNAYTAALANVSAAAFDAGIKTRNSDQVTKDYTDALKFLRDLHTALDKIAGPQPAPKT